MTARGDSLSAQEPRVQLQIGLTRTKGLSTSVPTTRPQSTKKFHGLQVRQSPVQNSKGRKFANIAQLAGLRGGGVVSNSGRSLRWSHAGRSRVNWAKAGLNTEGSSRPPT